MNKKYKLSKLAIALKKNLKKRKKFQKKKIKNDSAIRQMDQTDG